MNMTAVCYSTASLLYLLLYSSGNMPVIFLNCLVLNQVDYKINQNGTLNSTPFLHAVFLHNYKKPVHAYIAYL